MRQENRELLLVCSVSLSTGLKSVISYERCQNREMWTTRGREILLTSVEFELTKILENSKIEIFARSRFRSV